MAEIMATIRWFPLGPIEGPLEPIKKEDLVRIEFKGGKLVFSKK